MGNKRKRVVFEEMYRLKYGKYPSRWYVLVMKIYHTTDIFDIILAWQICLSIVLLLRCICK